MVPIEYLLNFLHEDVPFGDITTESIIPEGDCHAGITIEQPAVIAGIEETAALYRYHAVSVESAVSDGTILKAGDPVLSLNGNAKTILTIERTALNILGRMSGIATITHRYSEIVHRISPECRVAATRKTCPGFRALDKKAVMIGGGDPHRWSLSDGILIKDNHLSFVTIPEAVAKAKSCSRYHIVEIEVISEDDAIVAARSGAHIIMLDNMSPEMVRSAIDRLKQEGLRDRVTIEVSGGIDENSLSRFADSGVDIISIGALTHSVKNVAMHLDIMSNRINAGRKNLKE